MKRESTEHYYVSRKKKLLREFDGISRVMRGVLAEYRDPEFADTVIGRARFEFEEVLPTLPFIGGDENFLTKDIIEAALILAYYKALSGEAVPPNRIGRIVHETIRRRVRRYPRFVLFLAGKFKESRRFMKKRRRQAERSQRRRWPGDWVFSFVEGDGKGLIYGLDFTECGICGLYRAHGAERAIPINCAVDFIMADSLGMRLVRTKTLAGVGGVCDFRFIKK